MDYQKPEKSFFTRILDFIKSLVLLAPIPFLPKIQGTGQEEFPTYGVGYWDMDGGLHLGFHDGKGNEFYCGYRNVKEDKLRLHRLPHYKEPKGLNSYNDSLKRELVRQSRHYNRNWKDRYGEDKDFWDGKTEKEAQGWKRQCNKKVGEWIRRLEEHFPPKRSKK